MVSSSSGAAMALAAALSSIAGTTFAWSVLVTAISVVSPAVASDAVGGTGGALAEIEAADSAAALSSMERFERLFVSFIASDACFALRAAASSACFCWSAVRSGWELALPTTALLWNG